MRRRLAAIPSSFFTILHNSPQYTRLINTLVSSHPGYRDFQGAQKAMPSMPIALQQTLLANSAVVIGPMAATQWAAAMLRHQVALGASRIDCNSPQITSARTRRQKPIRPSPSYRASSSTSPPAARAHRDRRQPRLPDDKDDEIPC
jgi:hypothetical protein